MAQDIVIRAEGLGKKYIIGHEAEREVALRDIIARGTRSALRKVTDMAKGRIVVPGDTVEDFWALRDVNFEVKRGEVLGVIGRNGAGKSTLLKILSRITEPSKGRVTVAGRVSSLLEVGTGFHPELSGRENIYLNGAILGMGRAEIKRKFDEIVSFAEVERFLDTPVKRFSSGMYVRLAFAVAAHLEPEILIVDEVLSVGDGEFQRKCLGKMQTVAGEGRTVLFVSHNLQAVERLCTRGIVLRQGSVAYSGPVAEACQLYRSPKSGWTPINRLRLASRQGDGRVRVTNLEVLQDDGTQVASIRTGRPLKVRIHYCALDPTEDPTFGFALLTASGVRIFHTLSSDTSAAIDCIEGDGTVELEIPGVTLAVGHYLCNIAISNRRGTYLDYVTDVPFLDVVESDCLPSSRAYNQASGVIFLNVNWTPVSRSFSVADDD